MCCWCIHHIIVKCLSLNIQYVYYGLLQIKIWVSEICKPLHSFLFIFYAGFQLSWNWVYNQNFPNTVYGYVLCICLLGPWRLWVMKQEFVIVNASFFQILAATVAFLMPHLLNIFQTNCSGWKSKTKIFLHVTFFPGKTSTAPGF